MAKEKIVDRNLEFDLLVNEIKEINSIKSEGEKHEWRMTCTDADATKITISQPDKFIGFVPGSGVVITIRNPQKTL